MTGVALHYHLSNFDRYKKQFDPKIVDKALGLALNVAARKARVQISKDVRATYTIKARDLTRAVTIRKIQQGRGVEGRLLIYRGPVIGLDKFQATKRVIRSAAGKRSGVAVRIKKTGGKKIVSGGFLADIHGPKIFKRKGEDRLPIKRLYGPSIPQMVSNQLVIDKVQREAGENVIAEFNRQMVRLTQGA